MRSLQRPRPTFAGHASRRSTRFALFAFLAAIGAAAIGIPANAAGNPKAATGVIAERCVSCHEVPGFKAVRKRADVGAPSFEAVAKNPNLYTAKRLKAFLQRPHWPMTQFILSPSDIDNILAFIAQLR